MGTNNHKPKVGGYTWREKLFGARNKADSSMRHLRSVKDCASPAVRDGIADAVFDLYELRKDIEDAIEIGENEE